MKIYIDADDTLNEFKLYCVSRGVPPWSGTWYTQPRDTWTDEQKNIQAQTIELMERDDFWLNIPLASGAHELVAAAATRGETYILTAMPPHLDDAKRPMVREQKLEWAQNKLHFPPERVIVCNRSEKVKYAQTVLRGLAWRPALLIDDAEQNCQEWHDAGGKAILYGMMTKAIELVKGLDTRTGFPIQFLDN